MYIRFVIDLFLIRDDPSEYYPDQDKNEIDTGCHAGYKQEPVIHIRLKWMEGLKEKDKKEDTKADTQIKTSILFDY